MADLAVSSTKIEDFRSRLTGGGARASQFEVILEFPTNMGIDATASISSKFLINATTLPASSIRPIQVYYRGRPINVAGERQFADWTVNVMVDGDMKIRKAFEVWSASILNHDQTNGILSPSNYQKNMTVRQLDRNNSVLRTYSMMNCFPLNVGDIRLNYSDIANIEEFQVTFAVDYWNVEGETTSSTRPTAGGA